MKRTQYYFALLASLQCITIESFQTTPPSSTAVRQPKALGRNNNVKPSTSSSSIVNSNGSRLVMFAAAKILDEEELKAELSDYLKKRAEANADEAAKSEVGKVIGGTRGNAVLEFVSGSPNKERVEEDVPDIFDYDELIKYGYTHLVTPIMQNGGRRAMYTLMGLPEPATRERLTKKKSAPKLVIDYNGETDKARYSGLKMSQSIDDDAMGKALEEIARKKREGESLRKRLVEEDYVMPYADNTNKGPRQTPLWTPEKLDEAGRKAGEAQAWARKARMGELKQDPFEALAVEGELRAYSIAVAITVALAFGKSTPSALSMAGLEANDLLNVAKIPALALLVAGLGSGVFNGVVLAPPKKRSSFIWAIKGLFGGPLAVSQLRELGDLQTVGESEKKK